MDVYNVKKNKSFSRTVVCMGDPYQTYNIIIPFMVELRKGRMIDLPSSDVPTGILRRLYIIPEIGPWPHLPPGWTVIRSDKFSSYAQLADRQAYLYRTLQHIPPHGSTFPLPHRVLTEEMLSNRPETYQMLRARHYFMSREDRNYLLVIDEWDWLMAYTGDWELCKNPIAAPFDPLRSVLYTTPPQPYIPRTGISKKRPRNPNFENASHARRKERRRAERSQAGVVSLMDEVIVRSKRCKSESRTGGMAVMEQEGSGVLRRRRAASV